MSHSSQPESSALDAALRCVASLSRRGFLALGTLAAVGCAGSATTRSSKLPDPIWPTAAQKPVEGPTPIPAPRKNKLFNSVLDRELWCKGDCVPSKMDPMLPPRYITVHHDGMDVFLASNQAGAADRIETIRCGHRSKGWGDIGYHFIVDRGGRVWEGRDLRYQGAHVKDHNEGNIGVMCLGNFELQSPSEKQLEALENLLQSLKDKYRISHACIRTHREWQGARTICPGRNLQREMNDIRTRV
jgi:hypothetical protein